MTVEAGIRSPDIDLKQKEKERILKYSEVLERTDEDTFDHVAEPQGNNKNTRFLTLDQLSDLSNAAPELAESPVRTVEELPPGAMIASSLPVLPGQRNIPMKKASIEPEGSSLRELQQRYSNVRPPKTKRPAPSSRSGKYLNPKQLDRYNVQNSTLKHIK